MLHRRSTNKARTAPAAGGGCSSESHGGQRGPQARRGAFGRVRPLCTVLRAHWEEPELSCGPEDIVGFFNRCFLLCVSRTLPRVLQLSLGAAQHKTPHVLSSRDIPARLQDVPTSPEAAAGPRMAAAGQSRASPPLGKLGLRRGKRQRWGTRGMRPLSSVLQQGQPCWPWLPAVLRVLQPALSLKTGDGAKQSWQRGIEISEQRQTATGGLRRLRPMALGRSHPRAAPPWMRREGALQPHPCCDALCGFLTAAVLRKATLVSHALKKTLSGLS